MPIADRMISRSFGQRALVEAKMKEFEGLRMIADIAGAEKVREDAHTLLDSFFDSFAELAEMSRRGRLR